MGRGAEDAFLWVSVSLILGVFMHAALRFSNKLPYTVMLLLIGVLIGVFDKTSDLKAYGYSIEQWAQIPPMIIYFGFIPGLIFESSFNMDVYMYMRTLIQTYWLAFPGVIINALLTGAFIFHTQPGYNWSWNICLLFGSIVAATDPVAVVAILKDSGAPAPLVTIIDGEAILNDGSAVVMYTIFMERVLAEIDTTGQLTMPSNSYSFQLFFQLALGGIFFGVFMGIITVFISSVITYNNPTSKTTLSLASAYLTFYVAVQVLNVSGILAVMHLGLVYSWLGKPSFNKNEESAVMEFWHSASHFLNTLLFILVGVIVCYKAFFDSYITGNDWGYMIGLYIILNIFRFIMVFVSLPVLRSFGYGLNFKEYIVVSWSGLRGMMALLIALVVSQTQTLPSSVRNLFMFFIGGIAVLTLLINAALTEKFVKLLSISKRSEAKSINFLTVAKAMSASTTKAFTQLKLDPSFTGTDWNQVQSYITRLNEARLTLAVSGLDAAQKKKFSKLIRKDKQTAIELLNQQLTLASAASITSFFIVKLLSLFPALNRFQFLTNRVIDPESAERAEFDRRNENENLPDLVDLITDGRRRFCQYLKFQYFHMRTVGLIDIPAYLALEDSVNKASDNANIWKLGSEWNYLQSIYCFIPKFVEKLGTSAGKSKYDTINNPDVNGSNNGNNGNGGNNNNNNNNNNSKSKKMKKLNSIAEFDEEAESSSSSARKRSGKNNNNDDDDDDDDIDGKRKKNSSGANNEESRKPVSKMLLEFIFFRLIANAYAITWGYVQGHEHCGKIMSYISVKEVVESLRKEMEENLLLAREFMDKIENLFPEVTTRVKTQQACHSILSSVQNEIDDWNSAGQIDNVEASHLHTIVSKFLFEIKYSTKIHSLKSNVNMLSECALFKSCSTPQLEAILRIGDVRNYSSFRQSEILDNIMPTERQQRLFIVLRGRVKVTRRLLNPSNPASYFFNSSYTNASITWGNEAQNSSLLPSTVVDNSSNNNTNNTNTNNNNTNNTNSHSSNHAVALLASASAAVGDINPTGVGNNSNVTSSHGATIPVIEISSSSSTPAAGKSTNFNNNSKNNNNNNNNNALTEVILSGGEVINLLSFGLGMECGIDIVAMTEVVTLFEVPLSRQEDLYQVKNADVQTNLLRLCGVRICQQQHWILEEKFCRTATVVIGDGVTKRVLSISANFGHTQCHGLLLTGFASLDGTENFEAVNLISKSSVFNLAENIISLQQPSQQYDHSQTVLTLSNGGIALIFNEDIRMMNDLTQQPTSILTSNRIMNLIDMDDNSWFHQPNSGNVATTTTTAATTSNAAATSTTAAAAAAGVGGPFLAPNLNLITAATTSAIPATLLPFQASLPASLTSSSDATPVAATPTPIITPVEQVIAPISSPSFDTPPVVNSNITFPSTAMTTFDLATTDGTADATLNTNFFDDSDQFDHNNFNHNNNITVGTGGEFTQPTFDNIDDNNNNNNNNNNHDDMVQ